MNFKKLIASVMTASMVMSTGSTMSFAKTKKKAQAKVTLNKKAMKLKKGKKFTLKLTGSKASGKASVSNKKIVKLTAVKKKKKIVKNQWIITALKVGKAKITVKANKKKYICNVTVTEEKVKSKTKAKTKKTKAQDTQKLADQTAANKVIQMINALPDEGNVSSASKDSIQKAFTAYQNLSVAQTALVPGNVFTKLIRDYNKLNRLSANEKASKDAADKTAADNVTAMINNLPSVNLLTVNDANRVFAATYAYNALTYNQLRFIDSATSNKVVEASKKIIELEKQEAAKNTTVNTAQTSTNKNSTNTTPVTPTVDYNKTVAQKVIDEINAIPNTDSLTLDSEETVNNVNTEYNSLTATQKNYIDSATTDKLNKSVNKIAELKKQKEIETAKANTKINFKNSEKIIDIAVNDKLELYYSLDSTYYHDSDVVFKSSDDKIATVNSKGKVTGVSKGTVTITASVGDHSDQLTVNVHALTITFPQLPKTILEYDYSGHIKNSCEINDLNIEYSWYNSSNNTFDHVALNYIGKKTWNTSIANTNCQIGYKLYNSKGVIVDSGTIYTTSIANGESFSGYTYLGRYGAALPEDTYRLELLNVA